MTQGVLSAMRSIPKLRCVNHGNIHTLTFYLFLVLWYSSKQAAGNDIFFTIVVKLYLCFRLFSPLEHIVQWCELMPSSQTQDTWSQHPSGKLGFLFMLFMCFIFMCCSCGGPQFDSYGPKWPGRPICENQNCAWWLWQVETEDKNHEGQPEPCVEREVCLVSALCWLSAPLLRLTLQDAHWALTRHLYLLPLGGQPLCLEIVHAYVHRSLVLILG